MKFSHVKINVLSSDPAHVHREWKFHWTFSKNVSDYEELGMLQVQTQISFSPGNSHVFAFLCVCADIFVTIKSILWTVQTPSPHQPQGWACHQMASEAYSRDSHLCSYLPTWCILQMSCFMSFFFCYYISFHIGTWNFYFRLSKSLSLAMVTPIWLQDKLPLNPLWGESYVLGSTLWSNVFGPRKFLENTPWWLLKGLTKFHHWLKTTRVYSPIVQ